MIAFTTDIDWACEDQIKTVLDFFDEQDIPILPFITHKSSQIESRYKDHVGIHPDPMRNFDLGALIDLWPSARIYRAHAYFQSTYFERSMWNRGFRQNSNVFAWKHPGLTLTSATGMKVYPVYWEDDVEMNEVEIKGNLPKLELNDLEKPGLKVFDLHPVHFPKKRNRILDIIQKLRELEEKFIWLDTIDSSDL